jgi:hypothetical protein
VSDAGSRHSVYGYREMGFQATDFKILDVSYAGIGDVGHGNPLPCDCPRCNQCIYIVRGQIVGMVDMRVWLSERRELSETVPSTCSYKTQLQSAVGRSTERPTG